MRSFLYRSFFYVANVLKSREIPVWVTLLIAVGGAVAAYLIAPAINEKFELQRARREFVVGGLNSIAAETTRMMEYSAALTSAPDVSFRTASKDALLNSLRRSQFEAVKLVLVAQGENEVILNYQQALSNMQVVVESDVDRPRSESDEEIRAKTREVVETAVNVNQFLLARIGLR